MGLFNSLFGKTGAGKMAAAMNALVAKHMMDNFDHEAFCLLFDQMHLLLMKGGMSDGNARSTIKDLTDKPVSMLSMVAMTFMDLGLPPTLPKCFPGGRWNFVANPLTALRGDEDEIRLARIDIFRRYQIDISF